MSLEKYAQLDAAKVFNDFLKIGCERWPIEWCIVAGLHYGRWIVPVGLYWAGGPLLTIIAGFLWMPGYRAYVNLRIVLHEEEVLGWPVCRLAFPWRDKNRSPYEWGRSRRR